MTQAKPGTIWHRAEKDRRQYLCPFSMLPFQVKDQAGNTVTEDRRIQQDRRAGAFPVWYG